MAAFRRVAAYAPPGAVGLGLGLTSAIFRSRPGLTTFEFDFCTASPGRLATDLGVPVLVEHGPELFAGADLILLLPGESFAEPPPWRVVSALRAAHERGATLAAHCLGVFHLAATGLLDGLNVTTHWQYAGQLPPAIRGYGSGRMPSTSTRAASSPARGRRRASTCACT
jgi:DJ-1/PfpI family protein